MSKRPKIGVARVIDEKRLKELEEKEKLLAQWQLHDGAKLHDLEIHVTNAEREMRNYREVILRLKAQLAAERRGRALARELNSKMIGQAVEYLDEEVQARATDVALLGGADALDRLSSTRSSEARSILEWMDKKDAWKVAKCEDRTGDETC